MTKKDGRTLPMISAHDKGQWRNEPIAIRQRYIANELEVIYPSIVRIIGQIEDAVALCKSTGRGEAILVLGGSGSGKSHLVKMICRKRPPNHAGNISVVPAISFSIPAAPTQRSMASALLHSIGHPKSQRGTAQDLFERVITQVRAAKTEIILIDNVHDIPERRGSDGIMHIGNWLRDLIDASGCLVVLLGTPLARKVTESNAQLRRRVPTHMYLNYFSINDKADTTIFKRFLHELDKALPLAEECDLSAAEFMVRLWGATGGVQDYIFRFVSEAIRIAVSAGREKTLLTDFETAHVHIFRDAATEENPFSSSYPRLLDKPGEPFHNWFDQSNPRLSKSVIEKGDRRA